MTTKRVTASLLTLLLLLADMPLARAAHPADRPRDPKAVYIYHTYLSDNLIDKRGETIVAYTLVKGGDGPIQIRADLMRHEEVMRSWDWQSDPNIVVGADLPALPNGLYYFRVSATDGKTSWTEDSVRLTINRPDLNAVPVLSRVSLGAPVRFDVYMCGIRETSRLFFQVVSGRDGSVVREDETTYDQICDGGYCFNPTLPGIYYLRVEARPTYKTRYHLVSAPVTVVASADATTGATAGARQRAD